MNHLLSDALDRCLLCRDLHSQFARRGMDACDEALGGPGAAANWFGDLISKRKNPNFTLKFEEDVES